MTTLTYFTEDGTYGSDQMVLLITDHWTEHDWREIADCADHERLMVAIAIDKAHRQEGK